MAHPPSEASVVSMSAVVEQRKDRGTGMRRGEILGLEWRDAIDAAMKLLVSDGEV